MTKPSGQEADLIMSDASLEERESELSDLVITRICCGRFYAKRRREGAERHRAAFRAMPPKRKLHSDGGTGLAERTVHRSGPK